MANELDLNSMYSILKGIFNRDLNENYRSGNRSNFAQGLADLRNGWAAMQNDRRNKRDQAQYRNNMGGGNDQYPNGSIGATGDGVYGVNSMPPQPNGGGIGVDANGVYGVNANPQPNKFNFGGDGFDWSKVSPMPKENSAMDAWNNQLQNPQNSGLSLDKLATTSGLDLLTGKEGGSTFGSVLNGFGGLFGGSGSNPQQPSISLSNQAQEIGGQNVSANDLSRYLGNEYNRAAWIQNDMANNGVTNPLISMLRYDTKVAPLISAAKEEELRNAFLTLRNPDASEQDKMNAMALIEYRKGDPFLEENQQMRRDANAMRMQNLQSLITDRNQRSLGDYAGMNLEGQSWIRNGDNVDLSNAQPHTIAGLNHISDIFQQMTGKPLIVTSGNDGDMHSDGQFSHGKGWKIDVSGNGLENPEIRHAFIQQCQNLGIQVLDEYENPSANSTGGHLDLQFSGYRGNVKARPRNNRNTYTNGTSSYGNTKIKDMTEKEYGGIKTAITKLNEDNSAESAQALIDSLKNEYGRILFKVGSPEKAIKQLHEDLVGGRFGKLNQNEAQIKNIVASAYASVAGGMDERERKKNEEIAMKYLNGASPKENGEKPQQTSTTKKNEVNLADKATSTQSISPEELEKREQEGALKELDDVRDYDPYSNSDYGRAIKTVIDLKNPTKEGLKRDLNNLVTIDPTIREQLEGGY